MDLSSIVAQQTAIQTSILQNAIKASASSAQAIANIVEQSAQNLPAATGGRGVIVDTSA